MIPLTILPALKGRWHLIGIGLLGLALAVQTVRLTGTQRSLTAERSAHAADIAEFKRGQAEAEVLFMKAVHTQEQAYRDLAKKKDQEHDIELAKANTAADRYIAANRVRAAVNSVQASNTTSSTKGGSAESGDGFGKASELVAVTADDVRVCTENTMRLQTVRGWALELSSDP